MSDWRAGFARAATTWVIENGYPANVETHGFNDDCESLNVYIPFAFKADADVVKRHLAECELDEERSGRVRGFEWSQFEDTYSDNSEHHGIGVDVVCRCGRVKQAFVAETTFSEMLQGVLMEES